MPRATPILWRAFWCATLCTLLCASRAHANATFADFDGDGRKDRVSLDATEPSIVRVWLSATKSTQIIRSSQPLLAVTAVDLNGDRRSELVATTRSSGLHIWTKAHRGFRTYARKHPPSRGVMPRDRRSVDDQEDDAAPATSTSKPVPPPTTTSVHRRGPPDPVRVDARERTYAVRPRVPLASSSPRPPPLG
jgi:hypothetical protein